MSKKLDTEVIPPVIITQSPSQAIRLKCIDCMGKQIGEIRKCASNDCPIWPFRFGHNPFSKRGSSASEEGKKNRSEAVKARWAKQRKAKEEKK